MLRFLKYRSWDRPAWQGDRENQSHVIHSLQIFSLITRKVTEDGFWWAKLCGNSEQNGNHNCQHTSCLRSLTFARTFARVLWRDLKRKNRFLCRGLCSLFAKGKMPVSACFQILYMGDMLGCWELVFRFSNTKFQIIIERGASWEWIGKSGQAVYV